MAREFTDEQKDVIVNSLLSECKQSWIENGFKNTRIIDLCKKAGISKGAFYIFFDSKESIFIQVLKDTQKTLYDRLEFHLADSPNKDGVVNGMKEVFDVYCSNPYLYDTHSIDFQYFISKLNESQLNEMNITAYEHTQNLFTKPFLNLKVEEKLVSSVLTVLLSIVSQDDEMFYDKKTVFNFMIEKMISEMID